MANNYVISNFIRHGYSSMIIKGNLQENCEGNLIGGPLPLLKTHSQSGCFSVHLCDNIIPLIRTCFDVVLVNFHLAEGSLPDIGLPPNASCIKNSILAASPDCQANHIFSVKSSFIFAYSDRAAPALAPPAHAIA